MTVITNDMDHPYALPGYMLSPGDHIVGFDKGDEWDPVSFVVKEVRLWKMEDGVRMVTFTTELGTEMTFRTSMLFLVQVHNPEEKRK